jgi:LAO/AO transport system kinase
MQSLAARQDGWSPSIVQTVATEGKGVPELATAIAKHQGYLAERGLLAVKRTANWRARIVEMLRELLLDKVLREKLPGDALEKLATDAANHTIDPYEAVRKIASGK